MEPDARFQEGLEAFNGRDFYAAHDAWESLWLERFGEEKDFLQGLILCAVALHHYGRGNLRGARSRFRIARDLLGRYPDDYAGVDLRNFLRRMNGVMHRVLETDDPPPLDPSRVPALRRSGKPRGAGGAGSE